VKNVVEVVCEKSHKGLGILLPALHEAAVVEEMAEAQCLG